MSYVIMLVFGFVSILMGFAIHEFAHAAMADYMGDPTPKYEGKLTLNPFVHLDITGAIVLLLSLLFTQGRWIVGCGKPVAVYSEALNNPIGDGGI